jgi:hypothetical protein
MPSPSGKLRNGAGLVKGFHAMRYASIGSISSGTMRNEDLIPTFAWELNHLLKKQAKRFKRAEYRKLIREAEKIEKEEAFDTEEAGYTLEGLFEALEAFAPPLCYFGANEGDGADYGFWPSQDALQSFDGLKVSGLEDVPKGYAGEVLLVNDHGNVTFGYAKKGGRFYTVWDCV